MGASWPQVITASLTNSSRKVVWLGQKPGNLRFFTPSTLRYEFQLRLVNDLEFGGILVQAMCIAADSG